MKKASEAEIERSYELVDKLDNGTITDEELAELFSMCNDEQKKVIENSLSYIFLPVKRLVIEVNIQINHLARAMKEKYERR